MAKRRIEPLFVACFRIPISHPLTHVDPSCYVDECREDGEAVCGLQVMGEGRRGDEFFDVVVLREGNICDMLSFSLLTPAQSRRANAVSSSVRKQMEQKMCPVGVGAREAFRRRGKTKKRRLVAFENVEKKNENESENVDVDDRGFTNFDGRESETSFSLLSSLRRRAWAPLRAPSARSPFLLEKTRASPPPARGGSSLRAGGEPKREARKGEEEKKTRRTHRINQSRCLRSRARRTTCSKSLRLSSSPRTRTSPGSTT